MFKHLDDKGDLSLLIDHSGRFLLVCGLCKTTWFGDAKVQVQSSATPRASAAPGSAPSPKPRAGAPASRKSAIPSKKPAAKKAAAKKAGNARPPSAVHPVDTRAGFLANATKTYPSLFKK